MMIEMSVKAPSLRNVQSASLFYLKENAGSNMIVLITATDIQGHDALLTILSDLLQIMLTTNLYQTH